MTHGSLFTGIGGFDLAAEWCGWTNIFQVEIDKFCQKVLAKNFPKTQRFTDIKEFDGRQFANRIDVLSGGFPCQPFSVAGKRKGKEDDRALWHEMFRVISEVRPSYVVGENVSGIINMELDNVLSDLESEGYETQAFVIPACAVNAPHRRDRVWIVANRNDSRKRTPASGVDGNGQTESIERKFAQPESDVADTASIRFQRRGNRENGICESPSRVKTKIHNVGWSEHWYEVALRTCVRTLDDGLPNGLVRPKGWRVNALKAAGNAIVPQVSFEIMWAIKTLDNTERL